MANLQPRRTYSVQRGFQLTRPMVDVFGPSAADRLLGEFRRARDVVASWKRMDDAARVRLGQANRTKPAWRRTAQSTAMLELNAVRAGMRANYRALDAARLGLLTLGMADPV